MATIDLDYKQTNGLFTDRRSQSAIENELFYSGDHLQKNNNYKGYIGERPATGGEGYGEFMNRVEQGFISSNKIKEFCERHNNGVLGREPLWRLGSISTQKDKLTNAQKVLIQTAEDALTEMWNDKEFLLMMQKAVITALLEEKCAVRPYVLAKSRDKNGNLVKQKSLADALKLIRFEVVTADKAGVFEDSETFEDFGVYAYEDDKTKSKRAEITYIDAAGNTVLKVIDEKDITDIANQMPTLGAYISEEEAFGARTYSLGNLGDRLFLYEFKREVLITEQVRQLQKCLNLDLTMMMRNINLAGFRQKTITNAAKPKTDVIVNGEKVKQEVPLRSGLLSTPFLNGLPIYSKDASGAQVITGYTSPNINIADPVSVETFVESMKTFYETMLTEVYQLHVAITGDATASGKSRQEARAEFEKSLTKTKTVLDALGRWLIEVSLRFAANLCGQKEFLDLRCDFNSIVDAGTPDATERAQNISEYNAGVLSLETCLSRNGSEDTDVEINKIQANENFQLNQMKLRLDVINMGLSVLTIDEQVRILFPEKTDAEVTAYMAQLAKENPVIQSLMDARNNQGLEE